MLTIQKILLKIIFCSPEFYHSIVVTRETSVTKKMDQFLRHWIIGERILSWFNISPSSFPHMYSSCGCAGIISFCGFALAFDRHAKSPALNFNANSSNCISEVSCSLLFKFVTNLFKPWEILTHVWELSLFTDIILISTPYLPCRQQVVTSKTGPILMFPQIQPFGSEVSSSLGRVYSRQATEWVNCENSVRLQQ